MNENGFSFEELESSPMFILGYDHKCDGFEMWSGEEFEELTEFEKDAYELGYNA